MNEAVILAVSADIHDKWDTYDFCKMLTFGYNKAFTALNIRAGLIRSVIWPLDPRQLLSIPRLTNADTPNPTLTVSELETLLERKRR